MRFARRDCVSVRIIRYSHLAFRWEQGLRSDRWRILLVLATTLGAGLSLGMFGAITNPVGLGEYGGPIVVCVAVFNAFLAGFLIVEIVARWRELKWFQRAVGLGVFVMQTWALALVSS